MAEVPPADRSLSPMDGKNAHVIRFVYSEAVRRALLDRYQMTGEQDFRIIAGARKDSGSRIQEVEISDLFDIYMYLTTDRKTTSSKRSQRKAEASGREAATRHRKRDSNEKRGRSKRSGSNKRMSTTCG
ncbi:hypothetical protein LSH36_58g15012 [Paralvinella palmiformis]|uniref:Uncharacterized protein n=1 Tax=Paralvinella palmiformis TaxID=53620 RepID=A0AAD9NE24_9ANNE|nr:hypothetical protein LSH36_58g15012 [Paralvinella palmiformis]